MRIPSRYKTFDEASSAFSRACPPPERRELSPPLPLVLRPPLRKKKSFSRVSTWLFPGSEHNRDTSIDSVTNAPRPVKGTEGFYQCVPAAGGIERRSFDTVNSVSTWETDDEDRTPPTAWSPESTPVAKQNQRPLERTATFGRAGGAPAKTSGVEAA